MYVWGGNNIVIGENFHAERRLRLETFNVGNYVSSHKIIIGNNVRINWDCHIGACNMVEIHDNVLRGSRVLIIDHQHGKIDKEDIKCPPIMRTLWSKGSVIIEENCCIGEGVCIMPGVRIGKNSIIGANSVVTKDVPENCVVAGIPAKL